MTESAEQRHWAQREEAGSYAGLKFFVWLYRLLGRRAFLVVLAPVMLYFFARRRAERQASRDYLTRLYRYRPDVFKNPPGLWQSFRHFMAFGQSLLDKTIAWSGAIGEEHIERTDLVTYDQVMNDSRGQLMIGSHFGNLELCRGFAARNRDISIHVLMHDAHAQRFARLMQQEAGESRTQVIPVSEMNVSTVLKLREYMGRGDWLVITGDRVPEWSEHRQVRASFLGDKAAFPMGPYVLAATLGVPVNLIFAYREAERVKLTFERFSEPLNLPRQQREQALTSLARRFADRLAHHCTLAPYQWFNFYPFWQQGDPAQETERHD